MKYLDADYVVLEPGTFVRCAISGNPIPLDDLKYWSVDQQEPYADINQAMIAHCRTLGIEPPQV